MVVVDFFLDSRDRLASLPTQFSIANRNDICRSQPHRVCSRANRGGTFLMKIVSFVWRKGTPAALLAGCLLMGSVLPARAGLGANAASVETDAAAMQATMVQPDSSASATEATAASAVSGLTASSAQSAPYTVQSFVTPSGTTVREYIATSGTVFGVAWHGHRPPNLTALLGSYYGEYASASAAVVHKDLHRSMIVTPNSVVVTTGRFGHVTGHAYVPGLVPSGLDAKAVVK